MTDLTTRRWFQWGSSLLFVLTTAGMIQFSNLIQTEGWVQVSTGLQLARAAGWLGAGLLLAFTLYLWLGRESVSQKSSTVLDNLLARLGRFPWLAAVLALVWLVLYPYFVFGRLGIYIASPWTRLAVFSWLLLVMAVWLAAWRHKAWGRMLTPAALVMALVYHLTTYFPHVSSYPFGLWWSEVSRFYLASTFFDTRIYGVDTPWVFRDTTRYLMQAVPFLVSSLPLWVHRLWQALLRFALPYFAGMIFARRLDLKKGTARWLFVIWAGLFLFQGPVFYNLLIIVMLTVGLVQPRRFWRTLAVVAAASVWAGLSRINWMPMPGLIATLYYLFDQPLKGKDLKALAQYIWQPAAWVLAGSLAGVLTQSWYAANAGFIEGVATTSFSSDLIWKRLFPNPSYPLGIIISVLLVSAPLLVYLVLAFFRRKDQFHWFRLLGLAAITAVLFLGGLLVSTKIGGGTNLHNMDTFLTVVLIMGVGLYYRQLVDEQGNPVTFAPPDWLFPFIVAAPVVFAVLFGGRSIQPLDDAQAQADLDTIQMYVDQAADENGDVLFIYQRHLLTFGYIDNVELVHDYELMELMDNIMAGNPTYLAAFRQDLVDQRFSLIITDPMPTNWKNPEKSSLANENNVYLNRATPWLLCAYDIEAKLVNNSVLVLTPKAEPTCDQIEE